MPQHGMTCTPGMSDGEGGVSYDVENASVFQTGHHIHPDAYNPDGYVNEMTGDVEYANDDGFEPEGMPISTADNQIMEGLMELFPDYSQALQWAHSTKPAHIAEQYNQALDNNDWSTVTPMLEQFIQEYRDYRQNPTIDEQVRQEVEGMGFDYPEEQQTQYLDEDDWAPVDEIETWVPDVELADAYDDASTEMAMRGDFTAVAVLDAMSAFNSGEISQDEMYESLLEKFELDELTAAIERLPDFN